MKAAAICERPALWTQTKRTNGLFAMTEFSFSKIA
jgi:hypothetical protein